MKDSGEEGSRGTETGSLGALFVVNTLPPHDLSGAGEQVVQLVAGLRERGIDAEILGRGRHGARGPKMLFPVMVVIPVLLRLRSGRFNVVQTHESDGGLLALCLRLLRLPGLRALLPTVRLVALLQVSYDEEARAVRPLVDARMGELAVPAASEVRFKRYRTPIQRLLGRWAARCSEVVLVPSERTGHEIARDYGGPAPQLLPNATAEAPSLWPAPTQRPGGLLYVGRLRIRKGVEVLLWSLSILRDDGHAFELTIAGDGERRGTLEALTVQLGLQDRVRFLGHSNRAELRQELAKATALVVPSIYEGMPLVILEAMEEGVPVVASAVSGIPEVVVDGVTGWLVPPENVDALSQALSQVLSNEGECRRRGAAGKERLSRYRPSVIASTWIDAVKTEDR